MMGELGEELHPEDIFSSDDSNRSGVGPRGPLTRRICKRLTIPTRSSHGSFAGLGA
jgi:hypothetical protein